MKSSNIIKNIEETVKKIQSGEEELIEDFVVKYDKYIHKIVSKYSFYNDKNDLLQVARLHLIKSVYNYKDNIANFMQYSNYRIHTEIQRYIYKNLEHIVDFDEKYAFCIKGYEKCRNFLGKNPTGSELGRYLCIQNPYAEEIIDIVNNLNDNHRYKKQEVLIYDFDSFASDSLTKDKILSSNLSDKQKDVLINKYFGENGTCYREQELATRDNDSRQAIENREEQAIYQLKRKYYFKSLIKED